MSSVATDTNNMEENDLLPDDVSFSDADVERDMSRPKLRPNTYYRFRVTGARNRVFPKGTIYLELTCNPLDPDGKNRGPSSKLKINYPFANPKVSGHTAPNIAWAWQKVLNALYPFSPEAASQGKTIYANDPRRQKDGTWVTEDGQVVTKDEAGAIEKANKVAIRTAAQAYYRNPNDFVDEVFVASIEDTEYRDIALKTVCNTAPAGVELRLSDFADTSA